MKKEQLLSAALECGAVKATIIDQDQVVLSREFRAVCERNDCGRYNLSWTCPPGSGDIEACMARIRSFKRALWYQSIAPLEDSFDLEGMTRAAQEHAGLSQRIHTQAQRILKQDFQHLSSASCTLCENCTRPEGKPCRHPDRALPAMEGWGVDVYNTTKNTGLKYINGQNTVTYFGMVLFNED